MFPKPEEIKKKLYSFLLKLRDWQQWVPALLTLGLLLLAVNWLYRWPAIEQVPAGGIGFLLPTVLHNGQVDVRSALTWVFFGLTTGLFLLAIFIWLLLFVYNALVGHLQDFVPRKWHPLVSTAVLYALLVPCYLFQPEIKSNVVTVHRQVSYIVSAARNVDPVIRYDQPIGFQETP